MRGVVRKLTIEEERVWNDAIEAAAKIVEQCNHEGSYNAIAAAPRIRALLIPIRDVRATRVTEWK